MFLKNFIITALLLISWQSSANAQIIDSSFYRWTVYEIQENELDYKKCYIMSFPIKTDSNHSSRQRPQVMITRFQKDRSEEISIFGGFEYKLNSEIFMMIDDQIFKIKAKKDMAWAKTRHDDITIIQALLNGAVLRVRSNSAIGTYAVDEYSLKGITRAYARMREVCK